MEPIKKLELVQEVFIKMGIDFDKVTVDQSFAIFRGIEKVIQDNFQTQDQGFLNFLEWAKDAEYQKEFEEWKAENVSKNTDGSFSTQDAQYQNRLLNLYYLKRYYYKEFIKE
jgi:hypothetical protein